MSACEQFRTCRLMRWRSTWRWSMRLDGAPVIAMPFADKVQGRPGFLHGGAISGLLEMAAVAAIHRALQRQGQR